MTPEALYLLISATNKWDGAQMIREVIAAEREACARAVQAELDQGPHIPRPEDWRWSSTKAALDRVLAAIRARA